MGFTGLGLRVQLPSCVSHLQGACSVTAEQVLPYQHQAVHAVLVAVAYSCVEDGLHTTKEQEASRICRCCLCSPGQAVSQLRERETCQLSCPRWGPAQSPTSRRGPGSAQTGQYSRPVQ